MEVKINMFNGSEICGNDVTVSGKYFGVISKTKHVYVDYTSIKTIVVTNATDDELDIVHEIISLFNLGV